MAYQVFTELFAASILLGDTSQPQTGFQLRRTRTRKIPSRPTTKKSSTSQPGTASCNKVGSSIKSEASGPHLSTSRSFQSTMPSSTTSMDSGMKYTKTGRISKAQKGVRGAHTCECGKVSFVNLLHEFRIPCICSSSYVANSAYSESSTRKNLLSS